MEKEQTRELTGKDLATYRDGRDEMNLAELPLASISDRFLDGAKTVVFVEVAWDKDTQAPVKRRLSISGSDIYGLPTAKDDDVQLACVQLSALGDFHHREVYFSRYELLKLLRWPDTTRNYRRLSASLRRWKGVTVYSDRAFYDQKQKSWVTRDFGIFDNLYIYEREEREGKYAPAKSRFVWNEVIFESFRAGYLKKLDWDLYLSLQDPVAKRLYRFLDKRFYWSDTIAIDLHELAFNKIRVSQNYNTAQVKRALLKGIEELESVWELRRMKEESRFRKLGRGTWEAVFVKKRHRKAKPLDPRPALEAELSRRGVGPAAALDLVSKYPRERVENTIDLFDWYNSRGQEKGPGFLVSGIKSKEPYIAPPGFETRREQRDRKRAANSHKRALREKESKREAEARADENAQHEAFMAFWELLGPDRRATFERDALATAERIKRDGYLRSKQTGGALFEHYRMAILRDHFQTTQKTVRPGEEATRAHAIPHS